MTYATTSLGALFSLDLVDAGNVQVSWYGLLEGQTAGNCAAQVSNLTRGNGLTQIAVDQGSGITILTINNTSADPMTVTISVIDWTSGGCN